MYDIKDLLEVGAETVRRHTPAANEEESRQAIVNSLIKILTDTIAPDGWRDAGGSLGMARELMGNLVIRQSRENQRQVKEILAELREMEKLPQPDN